MSAEALAQVVPLAAVGAVATCGASHGGGTLCRPKAVKLGPSGEAASVVQQVRGWPTLLPLAPTLPPTTPPATAPEGAPGAGAAGR